MKMRKILKSILIGSVALFGLSLVHGADPVRYVQISTKTVTKQSGSFNVSGGTMTTAQITTLAVTTESAKASTITDSLTLSTGTITVSSGTVADFHVSTIAFLNNTYFNSATTFTATAYTPFGINSTTGVFSNAISATTGTFTGQLSGKGTPTNDSAAAGYIGEYLSSSTIGAFVPAVSNTYYDILSITLSPGDWDLTGVLYANTGSGYTDILLGISTTAGNSSAGLVTGDNRVEQLQSYVTNGIGSMSIPNYRASISTSTTYRLKFAVITSGSLFGANARFSARRMR
jgi:hypothetical protein